MKQWRELIASYERLRPFVRPEDQVLIDKRLRVIKWQNFGFDLLDILFKFLAFFMLLVGCIFVQAGLTEFDAFQILVGGINIYCAVKCRKGIDK